MVTEEEWRELPGVAGAYEVSDQGRVRSWRLERSLRRRVAVPRILRSWSDRAGYQRVQVFDRIVYVHALVLEAFVGPKPDGHEADHLDADPANNALTNLEWSTHSENVRRSWSRRKLAVA